MPFLGHHPYDGVDLSPDATPAARPSESDPDARARATVHRFAVDHDDERMLLDLLGIAVSESV